MCNVLVKRKCLLVSWGVGLQALKFFLDLRMSLRANGIAFRFHGGEQIMAGIIKAEPLRRSYKTPSVRINYDLPLCGFRTQYLNMHILP